jgi:predicted secreted Zn-dependent protease
MRLIILFAGLLGLSEVRAATEAVPASVSTVYYDLTGGTIEELLQQLNALGPMAADGRRVFGYTDWQIIWSYQYKTRDANFVITTAKVEAKIVYKLPRRTGFKRTDPAEPHWVQFAAALKKHEEAHGSNALAQAEILRKSLLKEHFFDSLSKLESFVDSEGKRVVAEGRAWDAEYDKRTRHGMREGAVLR